MDKETIFTTSKKIVRLVFAVKAISLTVKVALKVKECMPKYDKIEGIDTELLIKEHSDV